MSFFPIPNRNAYNIYRIYVTDTPSHDGYVFITEMEFNYLDAPAGSPPAITNCRQSTSAPRTRRWLPT